MAIAEPNLISRDKAVDIVEPVVAAGGLGLPESEI
jgi:hypothetical protein